jgi:hypothetical protein
MAFTVIGELVGGTIEPCNGGIDASHQLLFVLGEFGPLQLELISVRPRRKLRQWIPISDETMLKDGLLMMGLCAFQFPTLMELAASLVNKQHKRSKKVSKRFTQVGRLREACRLIEDTQRKVVLTLWSGAGILSRQCSILREYKLSIEVCRSVYCREYWAWGSSWTTSGTLDWSDRD